MRALATASTSYALECALTVLAARILHSMFDSHALITRFESLRTVVGGHGDAIFPGLQSPRQRREDSKKRVVHSSVVLFCMCVGERWVAKEDFCLTR